MADRKLVNEQGNVGTFEIEVTQKGEVILDDGKPVRFQGPASAAKFKAYIQGLSETAPEGEDSPLVKIYNTLMYGLDLKARARVKESVAVEKTTISRDGKEIDLMVLPVEKAVAAINAAMSLVAVIGDRGLKPFTVARRKLVEQGKAADAGGVLSVKK